jgi:hypothetical protein
VIIPDAPIGDHEGKKAEESKRYEQIQNEAVDVGQSTQD